MRAHTCWQCGCNDVWRTRLSCAVLVRGSGPGSVVQPSPIHFTSAGVRSSRRPRALPDHLVQTCCGPISESWVIPGTAKGRNIEFTFRPIMSRFKRFEMNTGDTTKWLVTLQALVVVAPLTLQTVHDAFYHLAVPSESVSYHAAQMVVLEQQGAVRHCTGPNGVSVPSTTDR